MVFSAATPGCGYHGNSPESTWEWSGEAVGGGSGALSPVSHKGGGGSFPGLQQRGDKARKREGKETPPPGTYFYLTLYTCFDKTCLFYLCPLFGGFYPQFPTAGWLSSVWAFYSFYFC